MHSVPCFFPEPVCLLDMLMGHLQTPVFKQISANKIQVHLIAINPPPTGPDSPDSYVGHELRVHDPGVLLYICRTKWYEHNAPLVHI